MARKHTKKTKFKTKKLSAAQKLRQTQREIRGLKNELSAQAALTANIRAQVPLPYVWTTGSGMRVEPRGMDDRHLQNAIFWAARTAISQFGAATWLNATFAKRIEGLHHLLQEAKRRGLEV